MPRLRHLEGLPRRARPVGIVALASVAGLALLMSACGKRRSGPEDQVITKETSSDEDHLEETFRALKVGSVFPHAGLLDFTWATDHAWSVLSASSATSTVGMSGTSGSSGGSNKCRAYAFFLGSEAPSANVWAAIAVFCDGEGLLYAPSKRPKRILSTPVMARAPERTQIDVQFVNATEAGQQLLWASSKVWGGGDLLATESAYVRADGHLKSVLEAVGADPASSKTASYSSGFVGETYPKPFRTTSMPGPIELTYEFVEGRYQWHPPAGMESLRGRFQ